MDDQFVAKTRRRIVTDDEEEILVPEVIDDPAEAVRKLKPVSGLNYDNFIDDLAANMQDAKKYSGVISGFFGRMRLNRQLHHVELFEQYLLRLRSASDSAAQLQETLLKNKIIFHFQAQIAAQRVKEEWDLERKGREHQHAIIDADISHKQFMKRFFDTADPNQLSETALILLNMMQPIRISKSNMVQSEFGISSASENAEYGSIEGMMQIKQQNQLLEVVMGEYLAGIDEKRANARGASAKAEQEESKAKHQEWKHERERNRPRE